LPLICDVNSIPKDIVVDVTNMLIGSSLRIKDLKLPEGAKFVNKDDLVIASITGRGSKADAEEANAAATQKLIRKNNLIVVTTLRGFLC
jgi:large subunit ribosomal protein L25